MSIIHETEPVNAEMMHHNGLLGSMSPKLDKTKMELVQSKGQMDMGKKVMKWCVLGVFFIP